MGWFLRTMWVNNTYKKLRKAQLFCRKYRWLVTPNIPSCSSCALLALTKLTSCPKFIFVVIQQLIIPHCNTAHLYPKPLWYRGWTEKSKIRTEAGLYKPVPHQCSHGTKEACTYTAVHQRHLAWKLTGKLFWILQQYSKQNTACGANTRL